MKYKYNNNDSTEIQATIRHQSSFPTTSNIVLYSELQIISWQFFEVANGILHLSWKALRFILCLCCARTEEGHSGLAFSHVFGKTFWNPSYIFAILRGSSVHFHNFQNIGTKMLSVLTNPNQQSFLLVKTTVNNIDLSFWILVGISLATYFTESCIVLQTNSKAFTTTGSFVGSCWYLHGRRKKKRALNSFLLL